MDLTSERVHTIDEWYDGPRRGAADYRGQPHVYWNVVFYSETDPWVWDDDRFDLAPISPEVLAWMIEADALHQRWYALYREGRTPAAGDDEPRVMPTDRARYEALKEWIEAALAVAQPRFTVRGQFEHGGVRWSPLEASVRPELPSLG